MWIRVLSEWSGSPRCGTVADLPEPMARERMRAGMAEPVPAPHVEPVPVGVVPDEKPVEVAIVAPSEQAVPSKLKYGKRK
jgi:hypothetical protein